MKIGVIGSMQYTEQMIEARNTLITFGHEAFLTDLHEPFVGKSDEEKEKIKLAEYQDKLQKTELALKNLG